MPAGIVIRGGRTDIAGPTAQMLLEGGDFLHAVAPIPSTTALRSCLACQTGTTGENGSTVRCRTTIIDDVQVCMCKGGLRSQRSEWDRRELLDEHQPWGPYTQMSRRTAGIPYGHTMFVLTLLIGGLADVARAQTPAAPANPALPPAAAQTLDALNNTAGLTINTAKGCCPPPTIWDWLGCKQAKQHLSNTSKAIHQLPLVQSLTAGLRTAFQAVGLAQPQGPPGPAPPGGPGAGGPGGPGGGAQGAGAVAAKIEANKAASAATIQNLEYLAAQDCNRYPEVVPAILQELDNPDELVRYTAITSLKKQCKNFRCSTLPATRILYRINHSKFCKPCGCCCGCQCQDQVIVKLTDLLLDKNALGQPRERSFRIREMASQILAECLDNRGRAPDREKRRVEPDPSRGPIPDVGPTEEKTIDFEPVNSVSTLKTVPSDFRSDTPNTRTKAARGAIQLASHSETVSDVNLTDTNRAQAALAKEALGRLQKLESDGVSPDSKEFQKAYSQLCRSTLQLAIAGYDEFESVLLEEAERWYDERSDSRLAMMAVASVCCLAESKLNGPWTDRRKWIVRRAKYLTFAADQFPHQSKLVVDHLMETADLSAGADLPEVEQACLQRVVDHFGETQAAVAANQRLNSLKPSSPFRSDNAIPIPVYVAQEQQTVTSADKLLPANAVQTPQPSVDDQSAVSEPLTIPSVVAEPYCEECEQTRVFAPAPIEFELAPASPNWTADVPTITTTPAQNISMSSVLSQNTSESSSDEPNLDEPWFKMTELPGDVYDRAFKALAINGQAMCFPECDDDVLRPYNNRSAIKLAPFSLFQIEGAQPGNVLRLSYKTVYGYDRPDRSEHFWRRIGTLGPRLPERRLDYQDFVFYNETGSANTSVYTEIPVRLLNPEVNGNTAGPGDMVIGLKSVIINDPNYVITSITKTVTPIGVSRRGLGQGFLSLEQGLLAVWRIGRSTHLHAEAKFMYPIGADPIFGGEIVRSGLGLSRVLWSDVISPPQPDADGLILTTELLFTSFLDGFETLPSGALADADTTTINHHMGLRRMWSDRFSTGH